MKRGGKMVDGGGRRRGRGSKFVESRETIQVDEGNERLISKDRICRLVLVTFIQMVRSRNVESIERRQ